MNNTPLPNMERTSKEYTLRHKLLTVINNNQEAGPRVRQAQRYLSDIYGTGISDYKGIEKFLGDEE